MAADLLTKGLDAPAEATPATAVKLAPEGIVVAIVAVTGVVDAVNDLIVPGAFAFTLTVRRPKVVFQHQWTEQVGRVLHVEEWMPGDPRLPAKTKDGKPWPAGAGALVATMQFNMRSPRAAEQWEMVRFYAETNEAEFSIGYKVPEGKARQRRDGVRVILQVDLYEFSHVLFGAAPLSMALDVKSAAGMHSGSASTVARPTLTADDEDAEFHRTTPPAVDPSKPWDETEQKVSDTQPGGTAVALIAQLAPTPAIEEKSMTYMTGSQEERHELIRDAARDLFCKDDADGDHCWVCVRATFDTEVIVTVERDGDEKSYLIPYTVEDGGVDLGAPTEVELSVVAKVAGEPEVESPTENDDDAIAVALEGQIMSNLMQVKALAAIAGVTSDALRAQAAALLEDLGGKSMPQPDPDDESDEDPAEEATETPAQEAAEPEAPDAAPSPSPWDRAAAAAATAPAGAPAGEPTADLTADQGAPQPDDLADKTLPDPDNESDEDPAEEATETPAQEAAEPEAADDSLPPGHVRVEPYVDPDDESDEDPAEEATETPAQEAAEPEAADDSNAPAVAGEENDRYTVDPDDHYALLDALGEDDPADKQD